MRSFWSEPFLWIHAVGLAALPIFLEICLLGLAVGDPILPPWLEVGLIGTAGIAPVLWMQWYRPFYIFSILVAAIKPDRLTVEQRRILKLFLRQENKLLAILGSAVLFWVLWQLYQYAPIAASITPIPSNNRLLGLFVSSLAFLGANLFLLVPLSVFNVLLTSEASFMSLEPFPVEQVSPSFTIPGLRLNQLLPPIVISPKVAVTEPMAAIDSTSLEVPETTPSPTVSSKDTSLPTSINSAPSEIMSDPSSDDADPW